jgi:hypothetical protein
MAAFVSRNRDLVRTIARLGIIAVIIPLLGLGSCPPGPGTRYSCGDASSGHCRGIVRFNVVDLGNGLNFGSFSTVMHANALLGGDVDLPGQQQHGAINNEIWVTQRRKPTGCTAPDSKDPSICWVEVGLSAGAWTLPNNETHVFWADNRPSEGFFFHDLGSLQDREFGHGMSIMIQQSASDPGSYNVVVMTCLDSSCPGRWWFGQSTDNAMFPDTVDMGMELAGETRALGGDVFFGTIVEVPGGIKLLDVDGQIGVDPPITAVWDSPPSSGNGGSFRTHCCF